MLWPDCHSSFFSDDVPNNGVFVGCENFQVRPVPSFYKGELLSIALTCSENAISSDIQLLPFGDPVAGVSGALFLELRRTLCIQCALPASCRFLLWT